MNRCLSAGAEGYIIKDVTPSDARKAVQSKEVDALLLVVPLRNRYLAYVKSLFHDGSNSSPVLVPIDSAGAIADVEGAYESFAIGAHARLGFKDLFDAP